MSKEFKMGKITFQIDDNGICTGEKCRICGGPPFQFATRKVAEVILSDDPMPLRHELTAYVCEEHFAMIFGPGGV